MTAVFIVCVVGVAIICAVEIVGLVKQIKARKKKRLEEQKTNEG